MTETMKEICVGKQFPTFVSHSFSGNQSVLSQPIRWEIENNK